MRRILFVLALLAVLLPSTLPAQKPAAAAPRFEPENVQLTAAPVCEVTPLPRARQLAAPATKACGVFVCTIGCVIDGYFGGFCAGGSCHCNGAESN